MTKEDANHLLWIYNRMTQHHGENPNVDYMVKMKVIIDENTPKGGNMNLDLDANLMYASGSLDEKNGAKS